MENIERPDVNNDLAKQYEKKTKRGVRLLNLIAQKESEIDKTTYDILRLILEQNKFLSHVEIVFISPKDEPDTGGYFHKVLVDEQTFIPTIFIVTENQEHVQRLKDTRQSSAKRVADLLGIDFSTLSPSLLKRFIIAHEIGHAVDYVGNYETNPEYQGTEAGEAWDFHYETNLDTMPVPGFDPVDLRNEVLKYGNLEDFKKEHADVAKNIDSNQLKTLQDLLAAQELAYRSSVYESFADNFATHFLKQNAGELNIPELINTKKFKEAA